MALNELRCEVIGEGLTFPTSLAFDASGDLFVAEAGLPWDGAAAGGRVWKVDAGGARTLVAQGLRFPLNGIVWHDDLLYVCEGGNPGRISRFAPDGARETVVDGLPAPGNYHTNMAAFGPDAKLYFSVGAMTNSGVVGLDALDIAWLRQLPHQHDVPGFDLELTGRRFETHDPRRPRNGHVATGAFVPFGTATPPGLRVEARLPCTAALMRCDADGAALELVAWGLRNAYGLLFLADGKLLAIDQGMDDRGSRPVGSAPDLLYAIEEGAWYGWPDFIGGEPVTLEKFRPRRGPQPRFVIANHRELPAPKTPLLRFPPHVGATKADVVPSHHPKWARHLYVALFGDEVPMTAPAGDRVGRKVVRVDPGGWVMHDVGTLPAHRPIDVRIGPRDGELYVLDFGFFEADGQGRYDARADTGRILRLPLP